jgi:4,5:9,10-diseco-3-hydroxy-5,9,17-trioxoandrosta-1(10),2-diene-4-oate hydrolase
MSFAKEDVRKSAKAGDITLNYYEAGESSAEVGGGLPFVMLHGGGPGASAWSNFGSALPLFAANFRTLLVDQPGFGNSDKPEVKANYFRHSSDYLVKFLRSKRCTCSATASAEVPRLASRSPTPIASAAWS